MKKMNKKAIVLLSMIAVLLTAAIGGTVAYLMADTPTVTNTFNPSEVPPEIDETLEGNVKKNVVVKNAGNVDSYIRAKIVVTWQDENGNVYPAKPAAGTDYTISINTTNWTDKQDGFYYYDKVVPATEPDTATAALINSCAPVAGKAPSGYDLHVEIIAQAIQADGLNADSAYEAWQNADK